MPPADIAALTLFLAIWLFYEPLLPRLTGGRRPLNENMVGVRRAWMMALVRRDIRLMDSQFLGHTINSASFFGSANMIAIAALGGFMFGGDTKWQGLSELEFVRPGPVWLMEIKVALMLLALARGMLDFVWAIRQLNYCLAAIGALPDSIDETLRPRWADALSAMLNPALRTFSRGVRAYYFALAAAGWFFGPFALAIASLTAASLLAWRQTRSEAAEGIARISVLAAETPPAGASPAAIHGKHDTTPDGPFNRP